MIFKKCPMRQVSLVILLTLGHAMRAHDSCEDSEEYLCGELCINENSNCHCGQHIFEGYEETGGYCCIPPGTDRQPCYPGGDGSGHCPDGEMRRLTEQCEGHCFNEYQKYNRCNCIYQF